MVIKGILKEELQNSLQMKHTSRFIRSTSLNRKRFNPSEINKDFTGQAGQAKEHEN